MLTTSTALTCDGVWIETMLHKFEGGGFGLYEGECRSGRGENRKLIGPSEEAVNDAARAAGWYVESGEDAMAQCPDCHDLSPIPTIPAEV